MEILNLIAWWSLIGVISFLLGVILAIIISYFVAESQKRKLEKLELEETQNLLDKKQAQRNFWKNQEEMRKDLFPPRGAKRRKKK